MKGSKEYLDTVREYMSTHTARECAAYYGKTKPYIYTLARELGVKCKKAKRGPTDNLRTRADEIAKEISVQNLTLDACGKLHGVSRQRIHQVLHACGYRQIWVDEPTFNKLYGAEQ